MNLNRETIKKILKFYYKKYDNIDCDIFIKAAIEKVGYYEDEQCVVRITQVRKIKLFDDEIRVKHELDEDEIRTALLTILKDEGIEATGLTINNETREKWEGYGMCEQCYKTPYFGGITIYTKELEKGRQYINQYKGGK